MTMFMPTMSPQSCRTLYLRMTYTNKVCAHYEKLRFFLLKSAFMGWGSKSIYNNNNSRFFLIENKVINKKYTAIPKNNTKQCTYNEIT